MLRVRTAITGGLGGPYLSTFYFDGDTQGEADLAADAAHDFWAALAAWMVSGITSTVEPEVVEVAVGSGLPLSTFLTTQDAVSSSASHPAAPAATQGLISWRTGVYVGAREIRGRTFVPGVATSSVGDGIPGGAYVAALASAGTTLLTHTADFGVYSAKNGTFASAVSRTAWANFAVLRSRRD